MTESTRRILSDFLKAAIKPLAGFCLRRGLKIQEFEECTKAAFLETATEELSKQGHEISQSRLSVMIGLHRRDVARISCNPAFDKSQGLMLMRLIGQWQQDKRYCLRRGVGRPLTYEGMGSEFVELVQTVSKDLNPYTILFELERLGAIHKRADRLELVLDAFEGRSDPKEGLRMLANDTSELIAAVEENIFGPQNQDPNLHSRTSFNNIVREALPEIKRWFLARGTELHNEARAFLAKYDKDLNPGLKDKKGDMTVTLGSFSRISEAAGASLGTSKGESAKGKVKIKGERA